VGEVKGFGSEKNGVERKIRRRTKEGPGRMVERKSLRMGTKQTETTRRERQNSSRKTGRKPKGIRGSSGEEPPRKKPSVHKLTRQLGEGEYRHLVWGMATGFADRWGNDQDIYSNMK